VAQGFTKDERMGGLEWLWHIHQSHILGRPPCQWLSFHLRIPLAMVHSALYNLFYQIVAQQIDRKSFYGQQASSWEGCHHENLAEKHHFICFCKVLTIWADIETLK
jgi:hypothetical protein